jgi:autotransporter translocation and assembly factor TamB
VRGARDDPSITLQARGESITRGTEVLTAPSMDLRLETPLSRPRAEAQLRATYGGLPVMLDLLGVPEGAALRLQKLDASFGPARLSGSGLLDVQKPLFDGALSLNIPDLEPFSTLLGQALTGALSLEAEGRSAHGAQQVSAKLSAPAITLDGRALALQMELAGGLDDVRAKLDARYGEAKLEGVATLRGSDEARLLIFENLALSLGAEQVKLSAPARIEWASDGRISLAETNLTSNRGGRLKLCLLYTSPSPRDV